MKGAVSVESCQIPGPSHLQVCSQPDLAKIFSLPENPQSAPVTQQLVGPLTSFACGRDRRGCWTLWKAVIEGVVESTGSGGLRGPPPWVTVSQQENGRRGQRWVPEMVSIALEKISSLQITNPRVPLRKLVERCSVNDRLSIEHDLGRIGIGVPVLDLLY